MPLSSLKLCRCPENQRLLRSPVVIVCPNCEGRLVSMEDTEKADLLNQELTGGHAHGNARGNLQRAADVIAPVVAGSETGEGPVDPAKRQTLKMLGAAYLGRLTERLSLALGIPLALIGISQGAVTVLEYYERRYERDRLDDEDVAVIDGTPVGQLADLARDFDIRGRRAAALLAGALAGHLTGTTPAGAIKSITRLLDANHSSSTRRYLLLRRAKAAALTGKAEEGLEDLEGALVLTQKSEHRERVQLLRQAMNHAYIALPREDVFHPEQWSRLRSYRDQALQIMDLKATSDPLDPERVQRAVAFDRVMGPGVLMFDALIRTCEVKDSRRECAKILQWHLELIKMAERVAPVYWIRYTPLAAQAIALGHLDFAQKVLDRAARAASGRGRSDTPAGVTAYATNQRKNSGIEWLFHKVLVASLHLARGRRSRTVRGRQHEALRARTALQEPLDVKHAEQAPMLLRAAKLYQYDSLPEAGVDARRDSRVVAFNPPAFSHWAFFPNLPTGDALWP